MMKQRSPPPLRQPKLPVATGFTQPSSGAQATAAKLRAAVALHQQGQLNQAKALYVEILHSQPQHFDALQLLATVAAQQKHSAAAVELFDQALKIRPHHADALNNRGLALQDLKRSEEALENYDRALTIEPGNAEALNNRGIALRDLKRLGDALKSYDRALKIKPDYAEALYNRGNTLGDLKRHEEALESYDRALKIKPDFAEALNNRGGALNALNHLDEALESYDRALKITPDFAGALNNRGVALVSLNRLDEALESYGRALKIKPDFADALQNQGNALRDLKRYEEALASYGCALKIEPNSEFLYGTWLYTRMRICDWPDLQNDISVLVNKVSCGEKASIPFRLLAISSSPALHRKAAEIWVQDKYPASHALPKITRRPGRDKIRVGYFSADYRNHPVSLLAAGLFETHDRSRFELTAFSFGPDTQDDLRKRIEAAFENFIDVRNKSDQDVAMLARNLGIDIAVDLGGFTEGSRTGIFAMRAAPLQLSYLGYLGTMGAEYIDYLIADQTIIPDECQKHYAEKIVYLPSYQANDGKRRIADKEFTREELGLPASGFVFCCFNNSYKISPGVFDGWMRILRQVEGSVLFLFAENDLAAMNLQKEAAVRGVEAGRLVFGKRLSVPEYLARYRTADLFLDTLPYNAGTTASDALWAGLPVLTCMGESFAGKVAASLLNAIRLPELITTTTEEYEALAIELATNPGKMKQIRHKLEKNRLTTPLFDTQLFTRHIEEAYTQIYERYQAGLPPEHMHVQSY